MRRLLSVCALLALCCGCATVVVREDPYNPDIAEALLAGVKGVTVQSVNGAWKDEAFAAECVLKGNGWHILRTDIGRHNAIDKAVGAAVLAGYDLRGASLFSSGRINVQTVQKAAR